jgi:hypothetical protein
MCRMSGDRWKAHLAALSALLRTQRIAADLSLRELSPFARGLRERYIPGARRLALED